MALDVGERRIGVAVSDALGITAQGVQTLQRKNDDQAIQALK
ncbi:MAG: Holliday junction resolvase RuvX, partial [Peptococcus niger]